MLQTESEYPSDLTEQQWEVIRQMIPMPRTGGRPRTTCMRSVINAIFYLNRSGCAWRYLPKGFPPWRTVYDYFHQWCKSGVWVKIHSFLVKLVRTSDGRSEEPSKIIIDAQSVRAQYGESRGWDGHKKVRGRKRQVVVDSMGLLWGVHVHAADQVDAKQAQHAIEKYSNPKRVTQVLGDSAYGKSPFDVWLFVTRGLWPQTTGGKNESNLGKQRWVVERTLAWFNNFRRLNRDYERKTSHSEAFLFIAQLQLLFNRIWPKPI